MNKLNVLALCALLSVAAAAHAHAHLEGSVPADQSHGGAPAAIELKFSEAVRLTALGLQRGNETSKPLAPLPSGMAKSFSIPVRGLAAGGYVVTWRAISDDGHVASGRFGFAVEPAAGSHEPH